jgi:exportin-T
LSSPFAGVISLAAVGVQVDQEAAGEAAGVAAGAQSLLSALLPAVLEAFGSGNDAVALPLLPFLSAYVTRLKTLSKRYVAMSLQCAC